MIRSLSLERERNEIFESFSVPLFLLQDVNPETEDRANEVQQVAESQKNEVKVQFADEEGGADAVAPLTPLEEVENEDDENRNKRFLSSLGGLSGSGSSGSGSGNFLFDILRVSLIELDHPRLCVCFYPFFLLLFNR